MNRVRIVDGEDQEPNRGMNAPYFRGNLDSVFQRHGEFKDDQIWRKSLDLFNAFFPVGGLANNLPAGVFKQRADSRTHCLMRICDQDAMRHVCKLLPRGAIGGDSPDAGAMKSRFRLARHLRARAATVRM